MSDSILIVDDEVKIAELLRDYFVHAGMRADVLHRGDDVEAFVLRKRPDLVVLDLQLPGKDGLEVCRALRAHEPSPAILMLTARVDEVDRLIGLELGADDYVCKPFSPREIVARAKAILRRLQPKAPTGARLTLGVLEVDRAAHVARVRGEEIPLTPIEFALLAAMTEQPHRVWSRGQLLERAKGTDFAGYERNIDGHIKNLRRKLREALGDADPVRSVYGVGYALETAALES
ncbi:MAG TPA: response regulator [Nevskiaceae bacterium]|nr:response regulator [Nevskiaceae bacterium]